MGVAELVSRFLRRQAFFTARRTCARAILDLYKEHPSSLLEGHTAEAPIAGEFSLSTSTIAVTARLRKRDGTEISHPCSFTLNEWRRLEKFATYSEELTHTALLSTKGKLAFSLHTDHNGTRFEAKEMPDADQFRALLLLMRPFVLQNEDTCFYRVRNILARRLDHATFRAYLDRQKEIFDGRRCQNMRVVSNGTLINSTTTLDLWLNAYEYHRDDEKRAAFQALHSNNKVLMAYSRALFIHMVLDRARAVVEIGNAFYSLQRNLVVTPLPGD